MNRAAKPARRATGALAASRLPLRREAQMRNAKTAVHGRFADRMFIAACTGAYLVLIGAVLAALRLYGG
jgi:hypothetical protein